MLSLLGLGGLGAKSVCCVGMVAVLLSIDGADCSAILASTDFRLLALTYTIDSNTYDT